MENIPGGRDRLINELASFTVNEYYDPQIDGPMKSHSGIMVRLVPERRLTSSPTGGVRGRFLDREGGRIPPPIFDLLGRHGEASGTNPTAAVDPDDLTFIGQPIESSGPDGGRYTMTGLVKAHLGRPGEHLLRFDASMDRLYACIPKVPKPELPAAQRRQDLLRQQQLLQRERQRERQQETTLRHSMQSLNLNGSQQPGFVRHTQTTAAEDRILIDPGCDHCIDPPVRILHARRLCAFHAVYMAKGRFITHYEAAAMAELEAATGAAAGAIPLFKNPAQGQSSRRHPAWWSLAAPTPRRWTVQETADFVETLGRRIEYMILLAGSTSLPRVAGPVLPTVHANYHGTHGATTTPTATATATSSGSGSTFALAPGRDADEIFAYDIREGEWFFRYNRRRGSGPPSPPPPTPTGTPPREEPLDPASRLVNAGRRPRTGDAVWEADGEGDAEDEGDGRPPRLRGRAGRVSRREMRGMGPRLYRAYLNGLGEGV